MKLIYIVIIISDLVVFALPILIAWQTKDKEWLWLLIISAMFITTVETRKGK